MANVDTNTLSYQYCNSTKSSLLGFLIDNIFAMFGGSCKTTESLHFYAYKVRSLTCGLVPLFTPGRFNTGTSQETKIA